MAMHLLLLLSQAYTRNSGSLKGLPEQVDEHSTCVLTGTGQPQLK